VAILAVFGNAQRRLSFSVGPPKPRRQWTHKFGYRALRSLSKVGPHHPRQCGPSEEGIMSTERLQTLAALDSARLTEIVRRVQASPSFEIGTWDVRYLTSDGMINPEGLFLFSGDGHDERGHSSWSVVLKVLQSRTPEPDPSNAWHWKREYWAMESGLPDRLPGPLTAPRCYGVEAQPDGAWIWMEHIRDRSPRRWGIDEFVFAAEQLGRTTGAWLSSGTTLEYPWLSRGIAHTWSEGFAPSEDVWANEYVQRAWSSSMRARLMAVWADRARLDAALARLPQTFAHFDSQRRNLMIRTRPDGRDELVAVDWAWCGIGPVGADAAILIGNSMILVEADPTAGAELDEAAFAAYVAGLRAADWTGRIDEVRLAYAAATALFCGVTAPRLLTMMTRPERIAWTKENFGLDTSGSIEHCVQMGTFGVALGEEALRLMNG